MSARFAVYNDNDAYEDAQLVRPAALQDAQLVLQDAQLVLLDAQLVLQDAQLTPRRTVRRLLHACFHFITTTFFTMRLTELRAEGCILRLSRQHTKVDPVDARTSTQSARVSPSSPPARPEMARRALCQANVACRTSATAGPWA
jgi:hypothetical protein